jgi:hypothetical protein
VILDARGQLELAVSASRELVARAEREPISAIRWLPLQLSFLVDPYPIKQIRAGNQTIGKTTPALALMIGHCLGVHPLGAQGYRVAPPPVRWWLVCTSYQQSLEVQRKLRDLLPAEELDPRTEWDEVNGFKPVNRPTVVFRNGSTIRIRTANQEAIDFGSASIDGVLWDEPPKRASMFTESVQRIEEKGGVVLLSYTPINAPTGYLRELCEAGTVHDHWAPLTPDQLVPVGALEPLRTKDGRPKDARWIAEREALVEPHERPVRIHGEWEMRSVERYFVHFREGGGDSHVHRRIPTVEVDLCLGIDHGSKPGKQIAVLIAVWRDESRGPWRIYVVDEYTDATGRATPRDDARGVLKMLDRSGIRWDELSFCGGDRVHDPGSAQQKSNRDLAAAVAAELERRGDKATDAELFPPIRTIKRGQGRGAGSVGVRSRWLFHRTCEDGGFGVHSRCVRVIGAMQRYDLRDTEWKDPIDAIVYGVDPYIFGAGLPARGARVELG